MRFFGVLFSLVLATNAFAAPNGADLYSLEFSGKEFTLKYRHGEDGDHNTTVTDPNGIATLAWMRHIARHVKNKDENTDEVRLWKDIKPMAFVALDKALKSLRTAVQVEGFNIELAQDEDKKKELKKKQIALAEAFKSLNAIAGKLVRKATYEAFVDDLGEFLKEHAAEFKFAYVTKGPNASQGTDMLKSFRFGNVRDENSRTPFGISWPKDLGDSELELKRLRRTFDKSRASQEGKDKKKDDNHK